MSIEDEAILSVLSWLVRAGETPVLSTISSEDQSVRTYIENHVHKIARPADIDAFQKKVRAGTASLTQLADNCGSFIFPLCPQDGWFRPLVRIKCEEAPDRIELRIRVFLFMLAHIDSGIPKSIGIRFEMPEGVIHEDYSGLGNHDYYHAQFIRSIGSEGTEPNATWGDYIPVSQPAFPLYAYSPLTLLFSSMMTIYGKKFAREDLYLNFSGNTFISARLREWRLITHHQPEPPRVL